MSWDCSLCGQWIKSEEEWKHHVKFHLHKFKQITIILGVFLPIFPISVMYNWDGMIKMLTLLGIIVPFMIVSSVYLYNILQIRSKA